MSQQASQTGAVETGATHKSGRPRKREQAGFWGKFARRFSGRGRIRSIFLLAALVLSRWMPASVGAGAAVFLFGILLHVIAKGNLVRNTQLCRSGPYAWVRNPFYVANFLIDAGLCLLAGQPWLALGYSVAFPLAYLPRILAEEEALRGFFGADFDDYCRQTPRLLPRSLPHPFAWLRETSYENLRKENELSRLVRLCGYPFFIAAVILAKLTFNVHGTGPAFHFESLIAAACACSLALWTAGELVHAQTEDGHSLNGTAVSKIIPVAWLLPLALPFVYHRLPLWLEYTPLEHNLCIIGSVSAGLGMLLVLSTLRQRGSDRHAFGLIAVGVGMGLTAGQIVLAPLLGLLFWANGFVAAGAPQVQPSHT